MELWGVEGSGCSKDRASEVVFYNVWDAIWLLRNKEDTSDSLRRQENGCRKNTFKGQR